MDDINKRLQFLKEEREVLDKFLSEIKKRYNYDEGFPTSKDLNNYVTENNIKINQLNSIIKQIKELEWKLMTPEEKKRDEEVRQKIRAKTSGNN